MRWHIVALLCAIVAGVLFSLALLVAHGENAAHDPTTTPHSDPPVVYDKPGKVIVDGALP